MVYLFHSSSTHLDVYLTNEIASHEMDVAGVFM
jgi:hypothetical protein